LTCRIKLAEKQYTDAFNDELESFKDRVRARAQAKVEEAMRQVEEVCLKPFLQERDMTQLDMK